MCLFTNEINIYRQSYFNIFGFLFGFLIVFPLLCTIMILVFGGTTEGRMASQVLEEAGTAYYYSTRGSSQELELVHGIRLFGAMESNDIVAFCRNKDVRLLVDAAHPFAQNMHRNIVTAAMELQVPVIRFERQYAPHTDDVEWCESYDDAISKMHQAGISSLLALTGVQTIGKLKGFWQQTNNCWFRILNREESMHIAEQEGFPSNKLVYFEKDDTAELIQRFHPQAIITKESGRSGGFEEKIKAAKASGVQLFVVCRPPIDVTALPSTSYHVVNGPHGLRRKTEQLLPEFFPLKSGLTTGTCATAATIAALTKERKVMVRLPNGEDIDVDIADINDNTATVIKQAGDDPDVTDGLAICATVTIRESKHQEPQDGEIIIKGGEGVGTVTLPGLGLPIGAPAINETPQRMIRENIQILLSQPKALAAQVSPNSTIEVTISVPEGSETGEHTFNPRIGVVGRISIIGTSGIVRPFSSDAWISSIRKEMSVGIATTANQSSIPKSYPQIVINSGAKSEKFLRNRYPELPEQAFVHYGNFIGETLAIAHELGVTHLAMGVMIGKAVKLAEGNLDTHSHKVTMNRDFIQLMLNEACIPLSSLHVPTTGKHTLCLDKESPLSTLNMARELWEMIPEEDMERFAKVIVGHCHDHCAKLVPNAKLEVLLISEKGDIF